MPWTQITFELNAKQAESFAESLSELGALSVTLQDAEDQPIYEPELNTTPIWQMTLVVGLLEEEQDTHSLLAALTQQFSPLPIYCIETLDDQDWVRNSVADFQAMSFGQRLWVCPHWLEPPAPEAINIRLDPGLAFGTGTHATTALCLAWLDAQASLAGLDVLDYGCGSGILGIAAVKLGATQVWGVDIDPQALQATLDNAVQNAVAEQFKVALPEQLPPMQVDLLLANILANPLCELAPRLAAYVKPQGKIVLSGLLQEQVAAIKTAYAPYFEWDEVGLQDGWARVTGTKNTGESDLCTTSTT